MSKFLGRTLNTNTMMYGEIPDELAQEFRERLDDYNRRYSQGSMLEYFRLRAELDERLGVSRAYQKSLI